MNNNIHRSLDLYAETFMSIIDMAKGNDQARLFFHAGLFESYLCWKSSEVALCRNVGKP